MTESGVQWLGQVPSHWAVQPLKRQALLVTEKTDRREHPVALENVEGWTGRFIPTETEFEGEGVGFKAGDVLFGKLRPYLAKTLVAESQGEAVGDFLVMRPTPAMQPRFLGYQLRSTEVISIIDGSTFGSKMPRASWEFVGAMPFPLPPTKEQAAISAFLDRETAKIDALVEEQKRLIELLKEKRQAVISQAITKGLDPNVPMKDSGVVWLGGVPAHWEVIALKREAEFVTSGARGWADNYSDDGELFLRIGNLTRDTIQLDLSDTQRVVVPESKETVRTRAIPGDLLFSITAYLGSVAVIPDGLEPAYVSQHVALVRLKGCRLVPEWAAYVAASHVGKTFLESQGYGGTKVQLSLTDVANLLMLLPEAEEQRAIVDYIEHELSKLDELTEGATSAVCLLQERRSALVSAAITGKIDVRGLAPQPEVIAA